VGRIRYGARRRLDTDSRGQLGARLDLPIDGPKTLNGLILEHLQDIPEADVSVKISASC
jgi:hypothetical protein